MGINQNGYRSKAGFRIIINLVVEGVFGIMITCIVMIFFDFWNYFIKDKY